MPSPVEYPNVKARLRLSKSGPGLPPRQSEMDIWMKGTRFRVRDQAGRDVGAILGDLEQKRGLGAFPASMEDIMDVWSRSLSAVDPGVTELYGDLATGKGWVLSGNQPAWPIAAEQLAPAAEQILTAESEERLEPRGRVTRLGRSATEYQGVVEGEDQGSRYRSNVTRIVSPPYLLLSSVRDASNVDHSYTREVLSLEEGAATDSDLELRKS
jgi:hypothetical protein